MKFSTSTSAFASMRSRTSRPSGTLKIQADPSFPAIQRRVIRRVPGRVERRTETTRLVAGRRLDLDHVGAVIGEDLRAQRTGEHARQVDDDESLQRAALTD